MIITNFKPEGGHHCITNSLKQIFIYNDYPISEQMLFGIGSGLGFVYVNLANAPMISGRIKPFEFEKNISDRLGIKIQVKKPKDSKVAFNNLKDTISKQKPVMLYVDMHYLSYLNMEDSGHFGGHSIVVFGFDDNEKCFYLSDRDNSNWKIQSPKGEIGADYHKVSYNEMEKARNSSFRPFPANNKWINFDFTNAKQIDKDIVFEAINNNLDSMLNAPANLLGINGIRKFAKEIEKWRKFGLEKKKLAGITNYFMISSKGGTGGGAFRKMYGEFLIETSEILKQQELANYGKEFLKVAVLWDNIATEMMKLFNTGKDSIIEKLPPMILDIAAKEEKILEQLKKTIEKNYN